MKRLISLLLLNVVLLATFSDLIVWSGFIVNRDLITVLFCENSDKPELECNGSCHLKKKIEQSTTQERADAPSIVSNFKLDQVVLVSDHIELTVTDDSMLLHTGVKIVQEDEFIADVFRPPRS